MASALILATVASPAGAAVARLRLVKAAAEPAGSRTGSADGELAALRDKVAADPKDRSARFALVRGLQRAGKLDEALAAAQAWRVVDAYNLVVVRLLGDLYSERGERAKARRAYSAVVELLPKDAAAHRALASVLKQAGDLQGAYDRLTAAAEQNTKDRRLAFELADVAARLGKIDEARTRFEAIIADPETAEAVRYPAKQRLAQIYQQLGRTADIAALQLKGGTANDIKVYLTWDTDHSDVDLWVTNPAGEKVFYSHKQGKYGEALYDDVTTGYGPESFTAPKAAAGEYVVQVNYFGRGRSNFSEARGEVVIVLDEGKPTEQKHVLPYRLFDEKQTVTVARIQVAQGAK
ncbi:MAG TPA: tetratricopeptide repeat protein [Kofleriaceae bacterium]|nr:tetratricopeptide repeat protein [Kofleriaceae bacterium]